MRRAVTDDLRPQRTSQRTRDRATALAWSRGCEQDNPCWSECFDAALNAVVEGDLDDYERTRATISNYWHLTRGDDRD